MLANLFYLLLKRSLIALFVSLLIILFRRVLDKKIPATWLYLLWLVPILSLLIPYRIETKDLAYLQSNHLEKRVNQEMNAWLAKDEDSREELKVELDLQPEKSKQTGLSQKVNQQQGENAAEHLAKGFDFNKNALIKQWIPRIWLFGVLLFFSIYIYLKRRLFYPFQQSLSLSEERKGAELRLEQILNDGKRKLKIARPIAFGISKEVNSPAIFGVLNPRIMLPTYCYSLSDEELFYVLYHELAHYKRGDIFLNELLSLLQLIYWFNPFLSLLFQGVREDIEIVTDQYLLKTIGVEKSKEYSKSLLQVLANANQISFLPKALGMVDSKRNLERRIRRMKLGQGVKGNKLMISILCMVLIIIGAIFAFTSDKTEHKIEIYALQGLYNQKVDYLTLVKDKSPVLTEKDIAAYNKETKMLFLSEDKVKEYWDYLLNSPASQSKYDFNGGSFFLGIEGDGVYIIKLDGELLLAGPLQRPLAVSFIPRGLYIKDGSEGLRFYDFFENKNLVKGENDELKDSDHKMELLAAALDDMDLLTDDAFALRNRELSIDTNKVYENRTEYVGDKAKVGAIISNLVFPQGLSYKHFSIESEKAPYGLTIHLNYEGKEGLEKEMVFKKYNEAFALNSKILFALVGNLEKISYAFDSQPEIYGIEYKAIYGDKAEEFMVVKGNRVFNTTPKLFEESSSILDFYLNFSAYKELDWSYGEKKAKARAEANTKKGGNEEVLYPKPLEVQLNTILEKMISGPKTSSNPMDYIKEHPEEYYQLKIMLSTEKKQVDKIYQQYQGTLKGKIIEAAEQELIKHPLFLFITDSGIEINPMGEEERELSKEELEEVNKAFQLLQYDASLDKQVVNPICHLLSSHFNDPKNIDLAALVRYMPGHRLKDKDDQHRRIFEGLKKNQSFPFKKDKKIEEMPVPLREIFEEDVDRLLFNYLGMHLEETNWLNKAEALYLEEYGSFYSYASDFGMGEFHAKSGAINKNQVVLKSDDETLVIEKSEDNGKWHILSFSE